MKKVFKNLVAIAIILLSGLQMTAQDTCTADINWRQVQNTVISMSVYGSIDSTDLVTWDFDDGTTGTGISTTHNYNSYGTYNVVATIDGACGNFTTSTQIILDSSSNPVDCSLNFYYESTGVDNEAIFYAYGEGFDETDIYTWNFGDSIPVNGQEVIHLFPNEGEYFVTLTSENDECGEMSVTYPIYIYNYSDTLNCQASYWYYLDSIDLYTVNFFDNSFYNGDATYLWDFGDGEYSTDENPIHTYFDDGQYLVTLIIGAGDCRSTYEDYVWVGDDNNWYPEECQALFYADYATEGYSVDFYDISFADDSQITAWTWNFGDGEGSAEQNPTHEFAATGEYTVSLTIFTQNCTSTFEQIVYIEESSNNGDDCQAFFFPIFDGSLDVEFFDLSRPTPSNWAWEFGDGATSTEANPTHLFSDTGVFTVTLFINAGDSCQSAFAMDIYLYEVQSGDKKDTQYAGEILQGHAVQTTTTAINNIEKNATISIYPNPVVDILKVDLGEANNNANISIFNTNGQLVFSSDVENSRNFEINTQDFPNGLYIMQVISNGEVEALKFIK